MRAFSRGVRGHEALATYTPAYLPRLTAGLVRWRLRRQAKSGASHGRQAQRGGAVGADGPRRGARGRSPRCSPWPLALARSRRGLHLLDELDHSIGRANLDGTAIDESFIDLRHHAGPTSVAVDARHIYWMSWLPYGTRSGSARVPPAAPGAISRARLDGTRVDVDFITGFDAHSGTGMSGGALVAVDDEHIYWTETFYGDFGIYQAAIARANLDGTGVERKFVSPVGAGIAVDNNYIYWTGGNAIGRAGIDGTRVEQDFIPVPVPTNSPLATLGPVEVDAEHVYWLNAVAGSPPGSVQPTIARANLDGTAINVSFIADWGPTFAPYPNDVAVDAGHVYWTNSEPTSTIGRADLDGSNLDQRFIVPAEGADLSSVAVDGLTDRKARGQGHARPRPSDNAAREIVVKVEVKAKEQLTAKATGKIKVNPTYKLKPKKVKLAAGETRTLKLKPTKAAARKIAAALKQGKKATAKLKVKLTDQAGNRETEKLRVRLKG